MKTCIAMLFVAAIMAVCAYALSPARSVGAMVDPKSQPATSIPAIVVSPPSEPKEIKVPAPEVNGPRDPLAGRVGRGMGGVRLPRASLMGAGQVAYEVVYIVDRSRLDKQHLQDVKRLLLNSLARLQESQSFVILMTSQGQPLASPAGKLEKSTDEVKTQAAKLIAAASPNKKANLAPALKHSLTLLQGSKRPGKLVFIVTGQDLPANVLAIGKKLKEQKIPVYVLLCSENAPKKNCLKLCQMTGGLFKRIQKEK